MLTSYLAACSFKSVSQDSIEIRLSHSSLSEEEKYQPCYQCHKDVTPNIYQEWYESRHGLDNVRCFQCHGLYDELKRVPDEAKCATCHGKEVGHSVAGKTCWECHPSHKFVVHR